MGRYARSFEQKREPSLFLWYFIWRKKETKAFSVLCFEVELYVYLKLIQAHAFTSE